MIIAKLIRRGVYEVIFEAGKMNPYRVVYNWYDSDRHAWRRKTICKYANLESAMFLLYDISCKEV